MVDEQREQLKRDPLINPGCLERPIVRRTYGQISLGERIAEDKRRAHEALRTQGGQNSDSTSEDMVHFKPNRDWVEPGFEEDIEPTAYDVIKKPKHYMLIPDKDVEVIDVIEAAIEANYIPSLRAASYANILKYLLRCGRKGKFLEDLKKAAFYLNRWIEQQELTEYNDGNKGNS